MFGLNFRYYAKQVILGLLRTKSSLFLIFYAYGFKDRSEDDE